jgi:hypothetical protein
MKQLFYGYYKPTEVEFDAIWKEAILVLDTCVMLNLYSYSESTSNGFLNLISEFEDRLWIPHQVALEFHKRRCSVILKETKYYEEVENEFKKIKDILHSKKRQPHITPELLNRFEEIMVDINLEFEESKSKFLFTEDKICEKITELFNGKVGGNSTDIDLVEIYKEGGNRYSKKTPPGFSDAKKPEPEKYGDYVLWCQLIEHAKKLKLPVIFVTDDTKEDWWAIAGENRIIGPRPELRQEFRSKTNRDIYIYSSETFIHFAKERGKKMSESAANEIKNASKERLQYELEEQSLRQNSYNRWNQLIQKLDTKNHAYVEFFEKTRDNNDFILQLISNPDLAEMFRKKHDEIEQQKTRDRFDQVRKITESREQQIHFELDQNLKLVDIREKQGSDAVKHDK